MNVIRNKYSDLSDVRTVALLADPACRSCWKRNTPPFLEQVWRNYRPDLFLVAGDLAENGTPEEYQAVMNVLNRYPSRLAAVPGDHDRPLKTFMEYFGSTRKVLDIGQWRFIGINTAHRAFTKREAEFLEKNINRRAVIFSHTPPGVDGWTFHSLGEMASTRFLSILERHASKVHAAFFGHIHGYSTREYAGIPLIATGGVAESFAIRNNRYDGPGLSRMVLFDTETGKRLLTSRQ
jgi:Icc protein